jgi:cytidylate kinase
MIIAIDGPAGAGKSTIARSLAAQLDFAFLDTGALYRATALASMRTGRSAEEIAESLDIRLGDRISLDGEDVTEAIRTPSVTEYTHRIALNRCVREALTAKQRAIIHVGNWVAEGRDIGTVVAPDAEVKVFLTASPEERARRRAAEQGQDIAEVGRRLAERDASDEAREHGPLVPAPDAVLVDSSGLSVDQVIAEILALVPEIHRRAPALFAMTAEDAMRRPTSSRRQARTGRIS